MRFALIYAVLLLATPVLAQSSSVRLVGIRAALISDFDGSPSRSAAGPDVGLFNEIIGSPPSHATLIAVDLQGDPDSFGEETVTLTARRTENQSVHSRQTATVGGFSDRGRSAVLFVLQDTGCDELEVIATLTRRSAGSRVSVTLAFQCGE